MYVVSIQLKSNFRRLHRIGACPLIPGRDYRHFELLGFEFPPALSFSATCGRRFRNGTAQPAEESEEASSSGETEGADRARARNVLQFCSGQCCHKRVFPIPHPGCFLPGQARPSLVLARLVVQLVSGLGVWFCTAFWHLSSTCRVMLVQGQVLDLSHVHSSMRETR